MSSLRSYVSYSADCEFPIQNLPYGVFRTAADRTARIGVAIGDQVLDLKQCAAAGLFALFNDAHVTAALQRPDLNDFMSLGAAVWKATRLRLQELLSADNGILRDNTELRARVLVPQSSIEMLLPATIGDYTDFYSSRYHAYNVGVMFRGPANALQPNWTWLPVGYHGRSSSVVVSGTNVHRPRGQLQPDETQPPVHGECKQLDFELELGTFVGTGNPLGHPIGMSTAHSHLFGIVLMNDWSARDIQKWEYVPLGPFTAKNFATSISPWIVTMEALEPFRVANPVQEPAPLPYLTPAAAAPNSTFDIQLTVSLQSATMTAPQTIAVSNAKYLYWTFEQQVVHHTVTGCNMRPGDLLGSGTISGPESTEYGSLLEINWKGTKELKLTDGSVRKFLQNGDTLKISGCAAREDVPWRVGFGSVAGTVLPPVEL